MLPKKAVSVLGRRNCLLGHRLVHVCKDHVTDTWITTFKLRNGGLKVSFAVLSFVIVLFLLCLFVLEVSVQVIIAHHSSTCHC